MSSVPKRGLPGGRLAFERAIRYSGLPAPARHLALTIATWADVETGLIPDRFQPAQTTLEEATGLSRGAVFKHSKLLEAEGWLIREGGGGRNIRTRHALRIPPGAVTGHSGNVSPGDRYPGNVSSREPETCHVVNENMSPGDTKSPPSTKKYPPSPPPSVAEPPNATDGRAGGGIAALDEQHRTAFDALLRITATDHRLTIGEREALELLPLVVPWLERTTEAAMREALTAGLPARVGSATGLLRTRLVAKLPPQRASPEPAGSGLPPWCEKCADEDPAARFNPRLRQLNGQPCPNCHPNTAAAA